MYSNDFWYSSPNFEEYGQSKIDLYAASQNEKPIIWHLAHIVHKEEVHIGHFLEQPRRELLHPELNPLVMEGERLDSILDLIPSLDFIAEWHMKVRIATLSFIEGLSDEDFFAVPKESPMGLCIANWLSITQVHTGVHLGHIGSIINSNLLARP
ncbi:MAG: DinB family protein [Phycisphaerae bacterium]|nr:DinB family protein [Phycisphaerae bacterium]